MPDIRLVTRRVMLAFCCKAMNMAKVGESCESGGCCGKGLCQRKKVKEGMVCVEDKDKAK